MVCSIVVNFGRRQFLQAVLTENESKRGRIPFSLKSKQNFLRTLTKDEIDDLGHCILWGLRAWGLRAFVPSVQRCAYDWPPDQYPLLHNEKLLDALFRPTEANDFPFTDETMGEIRQVIQQNAKESKWKLDTVDCMWRNSLGNWNEIVVYDYDEL